MRHSKNTLSIQFIIEMFLLTLLTLTPKAYAGAITDVSAIELNGYTQIYGLSLNPTVNFSSGAPYNIDNSGLTFSGGINRIGYYYELESAAAGRFWVWASMDAFSQDLSKIGFPSVNVDPFSHQLLISNLNVETNSPNVTAGKGIATGNIEIWPYNYGTGNSNGVPGANGGNYDFGDDNHLGSEYGSFQIHNHGAGETLFAVNRFNNGVVFDTTIGNAPSGHPDATFLGNSGSFTVRNFEAWVLPPATVPEPPVFALFGLGALALSKRKRGSNFE